MPKKSSPFSSKGAFYREDQNRAEAAYQSEDRGQRVDLHHAIDGFEDGSGAVGGKKSMGRTAGYPQPPISRSTPSKKTRS